VQPVLAEITKQESAAKVIREQQRLSLYLLILGMLTLSPALLGQAFPDSEAADPLLTDWSHHHLIFSKPATAKQAKLVQEDPRYGQQQRRRLRAPVSQAQTGSAVVSPLRLDTSPPLQGRNREIKRDWAQDLGTGASVGAGNYPAKFSFSPLHANCADAAQPDFVVYSTGLSGTSGHASIAAYDNLYSGCSGLNLGTAANFAILASSTVTSTGDTVVTGANIGISPGTSLTGFGPGVLMPPAVEHLGDPVAAQAQADANTAYTYYQGLTGATGLAPTLDGLTLTPGLYNASVTLALSAGATVTLNGDGAYIFQIGSTLTLAGTVVLSGGATAGNVIWLVGSSATLLGTAVAAGDIVAFSSITLDGGASVAGRAIALNGAITMIDNAVTTVDSVPSVYWAYDTGGTILTSPAFSLDGTQVLFVQTEMTNQAHLVLLKWAPSITATIDNPTTVMRVDRNLYPACAAPCKTSAPLASATGTLDNDTSSSVFYDYGNDTAYVGDAAGWLHKFTPVLNGILTEMATGGWPVQVNHGSPLTSPVHDYASGNVFVADTGGFLYRVDSTTAAFTASRQLDFGVGFVQGPVVDSTAGLVYVFASSDDSTSCGGGRCAAVYQFGTGLVAGPDTGSKVTVGASGASTTLASTVPSPLYIGGFDSTYEDSVNATGNLYVCGNTGGPPTMYQVAIQGVVLSTAKAGPVLSSVTTPCSPVTDFLNPNAAGGAAEWIFASVQANGVSSGCSAGGCVMNFKDTPWLMSTVYSVGQEVVDSNFDIQVVDRAGESGSSIPTWAATIGGTTGDGVVQWLDQGPVSAVAPPAWIASHNYHEGDLILDSNNEIELVTTSGAGGGISGTMPPVWSTTAGATTTDNTVSWENLGVIATSALAAAGGASGIVIDNTVGAGTLAGASQVYFSTLSNQTCGSSGTGGCAVQASQSALK
jgi:Ice-binding-like